MTAAALLCRQLVGQSGASSPILGKHAKLVITRLPEWDTGGSIDMYYWFYGSQALARWGGSEWTAWAKALSRAAVAAQRKDGDASGSWDPIDVWSYSGGRIYSTAMMALSLEAPFRHGAARTPP